MSSTHHRRHLQRAITPAAAALLLIGLAVTPAAAHPNAAAPNTDPSNPCDLQRAGTQITRCHTLTYSAQR